MQYRLLAGEKVSQLGFGAMRFPMQDGKVDEAQAVRLLRHAVDGGINYIDTAWIYHDGKSEEIVGRALKEGWRSKAFVATKMPMWFVKSADDFPTFLDAQLKKLDTDTIDFYLLHGLNAASWEQCLRFDALGFLEGAKKAGKIRHYGFSFHDGPETFLKILGAHDWEFCQIQYNILDEHSQAGRAGLEAAARKGTGVVVMEPLRGGSLTRGIPPNVQTLYDAAPVRRTPAEWALRWVWNHQEVGTVLSGMSDMAQLEENIRIASAAVPGSLSLSDVSMLSEIAQRYRAMGSIPCTGCRYCMPCPAGVDIPRNFSVMNEWFMFSADPGYQGGYRWMGEKERSDKCIACGACESLCPQHIGIINELAKVDAALRKTLG